MILIKIVFIQAWGASFIIIASSTTIGAGCTKTPVSHLPVIPISTGEAVIGINASGAASMAGVTLIVVGIETSAADNAETVFIDLEASFWHDATPGKQKGIHIIHRFAVGAGENGTRSSRTAPSASTVEGARGLGALDTVSIIHGIPINAFITSILSRADTVTGTSLTVLLVKEIRIRAVLQSREHSSHEQTVDDGFHFMPYEIICL